MRDDVVTEIIEQAIGIAAGQVASIERDLEEARDSYRLKLVDLAADDLEAIRQDEDLIELKEEIQELIEDLGEKRAHRERLETLARRVEKSAKLMSYLSEALAEVE